ncbi:hypothetical protein NESM_000554700 [Novymonas esmeraldas]|uniref:Uncharacterized protein n=1 Tax=Novymonas esmeraldas TaxID=1808958 RepID=A0AAW0EPV5_9TRYP
MHSPYDAVYGHDSTYIRRMSVEEYVQELNEEEADVCGDAPPLRAVAPGDGSSTAASPPVRPQARPFEQRRAALSSRNPNVVFSSKYPMYDRLGRELCVAFQMQDMAVQQELRRLQSEESRCGGGRGDTRRSGVRLSAELPMWSDTTTTTTATGSGSRPIPMCASAATAEGHELTQTEEASRLVRPSHMDGNTPVDVSVSATTSHFPSVSASRASSRPASARPSEFSIFRDSSGTAAAGMRRAGPPAPRTTASVPTVGDEDGILIRRHDGIGSGFLRAASMPPGSLPRLPEDDDGRRSHWRWRSEKRHRSRSSGGRPSRVRFINDDDDGNDAVRGGDPPAQQRAHGATLLPPRLPTPPPVPLSEPGLPRGEDMAGEDATRPTMASAAVRTTKQLFRSTTHWNASSASRATTTLSYKQPIASTVYGLTATAIAASKVRAAVEDNVQACAAALPLSLRVEDDGAEATAAPQLRCGDVLRIGRAWYRLVHLHLVAEVYEAEPVRTPTRDAECATASDEPAQITTPVTGDAVAAQRDGPLTTGGAAEAEPCPQLPATDDGGVDVVGDRSCQLLLYRWRTAGAPHGGDEARRAALGLSLCAPQVRVRSVRYADGGGVTVLSVPPGHRAVPMSGLPLSLRSYTALLRVVLKALSAMVARRTVHGSISALGELMLVWTAAPTSSSSPPVRSGEEPDLLPRQAGDGHGHGHAPDAAREPFMLPAHWERWVDFGMFVDRNAGRTIPFEFEDGTASASSVTYGKDVQSCLQLFLEHPLAADLTSEQYILLQKLIVIAAEPTQVANYLIQMKNLMLTLPTDTAALRQSFDAAVQRHAY